MNILATWLICHVANWRRGELSMQNISLRGGLLTWRNRDAGNLLRNEITTWLQY
jgi:hypothetical protein